MQSQPRSRDAARWHQPRFGMLLLVVMMLFLPRHAAAQDNADDLLREKVKAAIQRGQQFLLSRQNGNGSFETGYEAGYPVGADSLVGLSLINSGMDPKNAAIQRCLRYVRSEQLPEGTYDIGVAILFLSAVGEARDKPRIQQMAQTLIDHQVPSGGWGYGLDGTNGTRWDNSTTQFAILGLREACFQTGMQVDQKVWQRARDHWIKTQMGPRDSANGSPWGYASDQGEIKGSMTVAGLASLEIINGFLVEDQLTPDGKLDCCGQSATSTADEAIDSGVRWMNNNIRIRSNPGTGNNFLLYYLYGLERAGKFTGQRFFGKTDWYREGASFLVEGQSPQDGSFVANNEGPVIGTCLSLLFLSKGLSPVLINKLQYGPRDPNTGAIVRPDWNRHRHDVSNLVDAISIRDQWPHYISWQTLDMQVAVKGEGVAALQQAPVAYLSGAQDLDSIHDDEVALLREYIIQGGFLFAVQNCESPAFDIGFRKLITRLFPDGDYQLRKLDATHDVYRSESVFASDPPELWGVDFGCRTSIMYAPYDHSCRWDKWMRNDSRMNPDIRLQIGKSMQLGINVIAYATGRELRDKLQRPETLASVDGAETRGQLRIGRLKHSGGWDTAASAVRHLREALNTVSIETSPETPTLAANDPALFTCPVLYMHGRKNFTLSPEESTQLKAYFDNKGFMMADACCGAKPFDVSFRKAIRQIFGKDLQPIPVEHEMFHSMQGFDVRKVKRRIPAPGQTSVLHAEESVGEPIFEGIEVDGKYVVVYSKYDISCALEQQQTIACAGYLKDDAVKLAVNVILYAMYQ